jgi:hypothetical protein
VRRPSPDAFSVPVTRRRFVGIALVTVTGGAALVAAVGVSRRAGGPGLAELPVAIGEPGLWGARRIGRAWLRAHPEEADRIALERLLAPLPEALRRTGSLRDPKVLEWLRERQRADFAADRIVELDGWWLSQTEARLCAYLSLS